MKIKDVKFGMAITIGGKTENFAPEANYINEIIYLEELKMSVVQITNRHTKAVAWTSFANVVYTTPCEQVTNEPSLDKKGPGTRKASASSATSEVSA